MDPKLPHIAKAFQEAIQMLDETEPQVRHLVETRLKNDENVSTFGTLSAAQMAEAVSSIRAKAIKRAFRHLRDNLPSPNGL